MKTQNILVVDDNAANRKVLRVTLEAAGLRVFEAWNGVEALAMLERQKVDAIISDILMPRMDGYRFCHELRRNELHKSIPFIFYTNTYTSPGDEKLGVSQTQINPVIRFTLPGSAGFEACFAHGEQNGRRREGPIGGLSRTGPASG